MAVSSLSGQSSIYSLVSNLMMLERQPLLKIENRKTDLMALAGVYTDVKVKLAKLRASADAMSDPVDSPLNARTVSSTDSKTVSATAISSADLGPHTLAVTQLAKHHTLVSNQLTKDSTSIVTTLGAGDYTFSVTVNDVATNVTITLAADDTDGDVMSAVSSAINSAMADVEDSAAASFISDTADTGRIVLRSENTGSDYKIELADVTGTLLGALGIDNEAVASTDTTGGYIYSDSQLDAQFNIDGIDIVRSSNVISDVINGVTLTLRGTQAAGDDPVNLTVSADTTAITDTVKGFISDYNDAMTHIRNKTSTDRKTGAREALAGQFTYLNLMTGMRVISAQGATTGVAGIAQLADIGITQDSAGLLSISDSEKFESALETNPTAVTRLFAASDGIATSIETLIEPFVKTGGYLDGDHSTTQQRVDALDETVERWEARLKIKEAQLIKQYSSLQESLAQLNGFQNFLGSYLSSMGY